MKPSERALRGALLAFYEDDIEGLAKRIAQESKIENRSEYQETRFKVMQELYQELKKGKRKNGKSE